VIFSKIITSPLLESFFISKKISWWIRTRMNPVIQDILILELMLSSGEGVFIERGKSRVAPRLTDFSESEEDLSSDHPEHEGAALDVRSAAKERRKGP
jgi:hypothetical protein